MTKGKKKVTTLACASLLLAASLLSQGCGTAADAPQAKTDAAAQHTVASHSSAQTQQQPAAPLQSPTYDAHGHAVDPNQAARPPRVPAHMASAKDAKNLPPTLPAEQFVGQTRLAYQLVKEIPQTIAQLPCYCYCDEGFGHKSLYSCYEDDHAAHCAVCVEEVLLAYKLQKQDKLTPEQIRTRIVAQYSEDHGHEH
ncbi:MAG: CYCXC family (seleno)protein [Pyrinomonadaceae bacterium]